jgi:glycosyltransferase involved in cell wall biosynthesis
MKIVVGVTLFNSGNIVERTLRTIMSQTYGNFVCYITDDLSTDNSADVVENFIRGDERFILIRNTEKRYQVGNYELICREMEGVDDDDIFIEVDGDDWLPDSGVFQRVINHYNSGDVWLANGGFEFSDGRKGFTYPILDISQVRQGPFLMSHLRTWKVFLWRYMDIKDLKDSNGNWWSVGGDVIFMYDMLEMAGLDHYRFMSEINYVYNDKNPLNEYKNHIPKINKMNLLAKYKTPKTKLIRNIN